MKESSVLIIVNEPLNQERQLGIYEREFDLALDGKTHANIYQEFCHKHCPELERFVSFEGMIGKDCAQIFMKLGHLSYIRFDSYLELFIPVPEKLSLLQKTWLQENYHSIKEKYDTDLWLLVKKENYHILKRYSSNEVRKGEIEELEDIIPKEEGKRNGK